ncbi:hypothetical protein B0H14DRAFT_3527939 [Mycena olivaceomarginata]|nr:hypothetical protein B0H14DRAFT_3527939 [Mycena olivaceomarginata]
MFWDAGVRKTRAGTIFSAWTSALDFAPFVSRAVAAETLDHDPEDQEDQEPLDDAWNDWPPPDPLNQVDDEWPPPDPLNQVDDERLPPNPPSAVKSPPTRPSRKRRAPSPTFEEVVDSGPALSGAHRRRGHKRQRAFEEKGHAGRTSSLHQHVKPAVTTASRCPHSTPPRSPSQRALTAPRSTSGRRFPSSFDGTGCSTPPLRLQGRIFLVLAGRPVADGYAAAATRAYEFMRRWERRRASRPPCVTTAGLDAPTWLDNKHHTRLAEDLLANKDLARMAFFCQLLPFAFGPHASTGTTPTTTHASQTQRLQTGLPPLHRPFPKSVCSRAPLQLRAQRMDFQAQGTSATSPFGWCAIQGSAISTATRGGHLVLWDLKLVVEFPPGA